jgi:hypothetical protein
MLVVEENYANGVPQTFIQGWAPTGASWHWSAGGAGRSGWEGSLAHLITTRYSINASYHGGLWHEHEPNGACRTVIQWVVPVSKAAHSIAPSQVFQFNAIKDRATQEARFAEVRRILGAKAWDPNAACIAIAYAGMPLGLEKDLACPVFRADVQELARAIVEETSAIDQPHFGHGWIQPISRFEMDVSTDFIGLIYGTSTGPQGSDMPTDFRDARHQQSKVVRIRKGATIYEHETGEEPSDIQGVVEEDELDADFLGITVGDRHLMRRKDLKGGAWWIKQEGLVPETEIPFRRYTLADNRASERIAAAAPHLEAAAADLVAAKIALQG